MNRVKLSAVVLTLALGTTMSAAAKDNDHHDAHKAFERHEHHEQVRNHDRERWAREHREHERHEAAREHHEREAMHRYDRDHHRHPVAASHHEPKHEGWDRGHKTGFHGRPAPHGQSQKQSSYVNHHYDRHGRQTS